VRGRGTRYHSVAVGNDAAREASGGSILHRLQNVFICWQRKGSVAWHIQARSVSKPRASETVKTNLWRRRSQQSRGTEVRRGRRFSWTRTPAEKKQEDCYPLVLCTVPRFRGSLHTGYDRADRQGDKATKAKAKTYKPVPAQRRDPDWEWPSWAERSAQDQQKAFKIGQHADKSHRQEHTEQRGPNTPTAALQPSQNYKNDRNNLRGGARRTQPRVKEPVVNRNIVLVKGGPSTNEKILPDPRRWDSG